MGAKIGVIELPALKLIDSRGRNWTALRRREPLVSKQILIPQLLAGEFDVHLFNLKGGNDEVPFGTVSWRGQTLSKILVGRSLQLNAHDMDVWGVTVNYMQEREPSCILITQLASDGGCVVVGGSDAFAEPWPYLKAGAVAVVTDKSGAANRAVLDYALGKQPREPLAGVVLTSGRRFPSRKSMSPEDWPLPSLAVVKQCLGTQYWEDVLPKELLPIGSVLPDIGCDRHCDFCETPLYKLGYRRMSPERTLEWFTSQKQAGARSVICPSDQFLGRILYKEGRDEILEIMKGVRELGLAVLWGNGLELRKATLGRGLPNSDMTPDEKLVRALWGWDGKVGCYHAFIPAERPTSGREAYAKLLPWNQHCTMLEMIVRAGLPAMTYGIIVGLPDDSHETLAELESAIKELCDRLKKINPAFRFVVVPYAIRPLPGTPMSSEIRARGLMRFEDPAIVGGFWTACADTLHISYEEVSEWQERLTTIGDPVTQW